MHAKRTDNQMTNKPPSAILLHRKQRNYRNMKLFAQSNDININETCWGVADDIELFIIDCGALPIVCGVPKRRCNRLRPLNDPSGIISMEIAIHFWSIACSHCFPFTPVFSYFFLAEDQVVGAAIHSIQLLLPQNAGAATVCLNSNYIYSLRSRWTIFIVRLILISMWLQAFDCIRCLASDVLSQ